MKKYALLLALSAPAFLAHAQTPAADSLKGRIWTATAQRIWADTKPRAAQPAAWPTNAAFTSWLNQEGKKEKSGIGLLRGDVVRQLGAGRPATPAQVAQAILAEVANPPQSREWLRRLNQPALRAALQQLTPLAAVAANSAALPDTSRQVTAALATNDSTITAPLPAAATTATSDVSFFGHHPLLAGLLGALVGAGLTYALLRSARRHTRHRHQAESLATPFAPPAAPPDNAGVLQLQNEVQRLVHYIKELEAKILHYENANSADEALTGDEASPALAPPVAPAQLPHQPTPSVAEVPAVCYGPVPETPYLADHTLTHEPRPQLALMLTPDPQQTGQATFTLNPAADQAQLISDGLARLEQFFEYDPAVGQVALVEGAAPGRLQRQGEGWQVVERGWLHVS